MVSPCVDVLRRLASRINGELGSQQGSKHTVPDLEKDMNSLMVSLAEHDVYVLKEGRTLNPEDSPVPDVLSTGLAALSHGNSTNPITEFNISFNRLRERRKLTPISTLLHRHTHQSHDGAELGISTQSAGLEPAPSEHMDLDASDMDMLPPSPDSDTESEGSDYDEDFFAESPTLTRDDEDDVDLDMDADWSLDDPEGGVETDEEEDEEDDDD